MRTLAVGLLVAAIWTPAFAGPQFCSDDADTYYIEQTPHGFDVVRAAYSDICIPKGTVYICNDGPEAYSMNFAEDEDGLVVTFPDGGTAHFERCVFE